jgi:nucleoside-diphosphate-sugar epimerase
MTALVTGGGGFLGGAIVRMLRTRGDTVRSFTRSRYPWLDELGVEQHLGDLGDAEAVRQAAIECDVVFHVAAKAGVWGRKDDFVLTNVTGTENVIAACRAFGIPKLVFTSTPSVIHAGIDNENADESLPYPEKFDADYPKTKAAAEQLVLAANDSNLATVALRPHLIWGPGDPHLLPRIVERGRRRKLRKLGDRPVTVDTTFVTNAADAHLLAADRLLPGTACAGQVYFVSDGQPVVMWDFINELLAIHGIAPVTTVMPLGRAKFLASMLERVYRVFGIKAEPPLTRFVVSQLSTSHHYDITAIRRDLGYAPRVSVAEGLKLLAATVNPIRA